MDAAWMRVIDLNQRSPPIFGRIHLQVVCRGSQAVRNMHLVGVKCSCSTIAKLSKFMNERPGMTFVLRGSFYIADTGLQQRLAALQMEVNVSRYSASGGWSAQSGELSAQSGELSAVRMQHQPRR